MPIQTLTPTSKIDMQRIFKDQQYRKEVAKRSHAHYFSIYHREHAQLPSAPMHRGLFAMTESNEKYSVIKAFRGSGKSTICTFSYPMWAVLGKPEKKFVVIVSKTQEQAQRHLDNVKQEFELNERLRNDFGIIHEENSPWNARALSFHTHGAMIAAISIDQSMRGIRFRQHRPDLIIFDDIETRDAMKTKEGRDQLFERITSDFLPAGSPDCRALFIGSNLHADSVLNRLIEGQKSGTLDAGVYEYPIVDDDGNPTWLAMYADKDAIAEKRRQIPDPRAWKQEYELIALVPEDQLVQDSSFIEYDPEELPEEYAIVISIDPAIKKGAANDYTGIVTFAVTGDREKQRLYVLPDIVRKRLGPTEIQEEVTRIVAKHSERTVHVIIEDVGFQSALTEFVGRVSGVEKRRIHLFHPKNSKEDRLYAASGYMEQGVVRFPKGQYQTLRDEITELGVGKHDDLADAFTAGVLTIKEKNIRIVSIGMTLLATKGMTQEDLDQQRADIAAGAKETVRINGEFLTYQKVRREKLRGMGIVGSVPIYF